MLDTDKIRAAIDAYSASQPEERYEVHIPADKGVPRKYLGLSALGDTCKRKVWYNWRQCLREPFPPRLYRLFRRGAREEYAINHTLRGIGFTVHDVDGEGNQFKVTDFGGHLSGHVDGVGEAPQEFWVSGAKPVPFLLEYKTYNVKRFVKLQREFVRRADPKYYTQMQCYMGYLKLCGALFFAVCKDDDMIHMEWVKFKPNDFWSAVGAAELIISAQSPTEVPRVSDTASWFECRYCHFKGICHGKDNSVKSCRSCKFGMPQGDGTWTCEKGGEFGKVCGKYSDIARG